MHEKLNSKRRLRQLERDAVAVREHQQQQEEKQVGEEKEEVDDRDVVEVEDSGGVEEEREVEDGEAGVGEAEVEELVQGEEQQTEVEDREAGEAEVEELGQGEGEGEEQLQQQQQRRQLVGELEIGEVLHGPSSHGISASMCCEELEERMDCIKEDPYLKVVIEDIEIGGPDVMMRYLSDPEVLWKLGHAMGFGV